MCKCCEEIEFWENEKNPNFKQKIFAKLSIYRWNKDVKAIKGNQRSTIVTKAFDLKYCPTCGRKLGGKE